jgi:hypothetical protein
VAHRRFAKARTFVGSQVRPFAIGAPAPAAFGAMEPGAAATRVVRFPGYGTCGRPASLSVGLMDRGVWLGSLQVPLRPDEDGRD